MCVTGRGDDVVGGARDHAVVRERDLFTGPVQLMNVPRADVDLFRYTLRAYAVGALPGWPLLSLSIWCALGLLAAWKGFRWTS